MGLAFNENTSNPFAPTLFVELLFEKAPEIDASQLLTEMIKNCGDVEIINNSSEFLVFSFPNFCIPGKDKHDIPQCVLLKRIQNIGLNLYKASLGQTWDWPQKDSTVRKCRYKLIFSDFVPSKLTNISRIKNFNLALVSLLNVVSCNAIHWYTAMRFTSPEVFRKIIHEKHEQDYLFGALNVRLFSINKLSEEFIMDTIGMKSFNLPDLQCHFKNLKIRDVSNFLTDLAYYLFENGSIIKHHDRVKGISKNSDWFCRYENSLFPPDRPVIDIEPEFPFAAGTRSI